PAFFWWMFPVILGMVLSVPFTVLTSRASLGRRLRAWGLLLTPEEQTPPPEIRALQQHVVLDPAEADAVQPAQLPGRAPLTMIATTPVYLLSRLWRRARHPKGGPPPA